MKQNTSQIEELARKLVLAREEEAIARSARIELEEGIAELVDTPANGCRTVNAGEGLKITVKRALSYKADVNAMRSGEVIPGELMPLKQIPPKPAEYVFDAKKYEQLIKNDLDTAAKLAEYIVTKPRKVTVTLKIA